MTATMPAPRVRIPREAHEWVPVTVTALADGTPVDDVTIRFALLPPGTRPGPGDWTTPTADPDGGDRVGLILTPVTRPATAGIWVEIVDGQFTYPLEPNAVGWIERT